MYHLVINLGGFHCQVIKTDINGNETVVFNGSKPDAKAFYARVK